MTESEDNKKLTAEVAEIDLQMAALAERKRRRLIQLSIAESPENIMSREERREALAEAFAEAIVYLGQRGMLPLKDAAVTANAEKPNPCKSISRRKQKKRK